MKGTALGADDTHEAIVNLGEVSRGWLRAVGIESRRDLERVGAVAAYCRVRDAGFKPSLNLLYAMHAGLMDLHWTLLPPRERERLKREVSECSNAKSSSARSSRR